MSTSDDLAVNRWDPVPPDELASILRPASFDWCLAGGHAIEGFVGECYRDHGDTDLVVFRSDQLALQHCLQGWRLFAADPPGRLRRWRRGEILADEVHDIWGHRPGADAWELQVMLQDADDASWYYRRDPRIRGKRSEFIEPLGGLPCISIPIQLLYKSAGLRGRDRQDFERCLPLLDHDERTVLRRLLALAYPEGHEWLERLSGENR